MAEKDHPVTVVREGNKQTIPQSEIVPGDIIFLN